MKTSECARIQWNKNGSHRCINYTALMMLIHNAYLLLLCCETKVLFFLQCYTELCSVPYRGWRVPWDILNCTVFHTEVGGLPWDSKCFVFNHNV